MYEVDFNSVIHEFVILTTIGIMEDGYLPFDVNLLATVDSNLVKLFKGEKELVRKYFEVNYHRIFIQDGKEPLIYVIDNRNSSVGEYLTRTKRDLLETIIRKLLINIYAALRTVVFYHQYVGEVESISSLKVNQLLASFGLPEKLMFLPDTMKRRLLRVLIRLYKRKGTKHALKLLNKVLGLNINLYEVYAYYSFSGENRIKYEFYDEKEKRWEEVEEDLYRNDVRAFVTEQTFLR